MDFVGRLLEALTQVVRDFFVWLGSFAGLGEYGAGFVAGLVFATFIGFIIYRMNIWMRNATAAYRPQRVIEMTARTPSEVVSSSADATMKITGVLVLGLTLVLLAVGLADLQDAAITGAFGVLLLLVGGLTG